jgi:hypothetical protein
MNITGALPIQALAANQDNSFQGQHTSIHKKDSDVDS